MATDDKNGDAKGQILHLSRHRKFRAQERIPIGSAALVEVNLRDEQDQIIDLGAWKGRVLPNGTIAFDVETNDGQVLMIRWTSEQARAVKNAISKLSLFSTMKLRRLRGADLWRARPDPEHEGWFIVRHDDRERAFRPSKIRTARSRRSGQTWEHECAGCGSKMPAGTIAYVQAEREPWEYPSWTNVRLCRGCLQPMLETIQSVANETSAERTELTLLPKL